MTAHQAPLSSTVSQRLLKFFSIKSVILSNHRILFHPLLLLSSVFLVSLLFTSGGQSIGISATASLLPMNDYSECLTGLISLQYNRLSRVLSSTTIQKHQFFCVQPFLWSSSHIYLTTGKNIALTRQAFVDKVVPLLFNMLSGFVIACFSRSKHS